MREFDSTAGAALREQVIRIKSEQRAALLDEHRLAIDYLENRQVRDVETELLSRFPNSQSGDAGQWIQPLTLPITQRFIAEQANAYNKGVTRVLTWGDGSEDDETKRQTTKMVSALEACRYDEILHGLERYVRLLKGCCLWFQIHRGTLRPVVVLPASIYPIASTDPQSDPSDPDDYDGFVVESETDREDVATAAGYSYALITREQTEFYSGPGPSRPESVGEKIPNRFRWRHRNGKVLQGRVLTFWHESLSTGLIPHEDAIVARANREINIAWSVLFDTLRMQSFSTPVMNLANPGASEALRAHGARFPVSLQIGESFDYANAGAPYSEIVSVLERYSKSLAVAMRMSPNDFSIDTEQAISGFAKNIDSLPKIESREEHIRALSWVETHEAGPPLIAGLMLTGQLDSAAADMRLRATFGKVQFPRTEDERAKEIETDIKYGFATAAEILSERKRVSVDEARGIVERNLAERPPTDRQSGVGLFAGIIGRRGRSDARSAAREDRQQRGAGGEGDRDSEDRGDGIDQ